MIAKLFKSEPMRSVPVADDESHRVAPDYKGKLATTPAPGVNTLYDCAKYSFENVGAPQHFLVFLCVCYFVDKIDIAIMKIGICLLFYQILTKTKRIPLFVMNCFVSIWNSLKILYVTVPQQYLYAKTSIYSMEVTQSERIWT